LTFEKRKKKFTTGFGIGESPGLHWRNVFGFEHRGNEEFIVVIKNRADVRRMAYLEWLRELRPRGRIAVIWDCCPSHKDKLVKVRALELGIRLVFIPRGMTDVLQPLDRKIFGNLKQRAKGGVTRRHSGSPPKM
jgi:hypothetical protein